MLHPKAALSSNCFEFRVKHGDLSVGRGAVESKEVILPCGDEPVSIDPKICLIIPYL